MKNNVKFDKPVSDVLYEKVGKRYQPVSQYYTVDYWRSGTYVVTIQPGIRSSSRMVYPKTVPEIEATLKIMGEGMIKAMCEASVTPVQPKPEELTDKQKKALKLWREAFDATPVWFPSKQCIIDAGLDELRKFLNMQHKG